MKNRPKKLMGVVGVLAFLTTQSLAQQPNTGFSTQLVNGVNGPPFPLQVTLPLNVPATIRLQGQSRAPFIAFAAAGVLATGFPALGGQLVDLQPATLAIVADGTRIPAFRLDDTGRFLASFVPAPPGVTQGATAALQTMIASPFHVSGVSLSAATAVTVVPGVTRMVLSLGDDTSQNISLAPFGFSIPFYTQSYTSFFVSSNGYISFNSAANDFTPTPAEFLGQMPRIAMFWSDLTPSVGGTVVVEVDEIPPSQQVRVLFTEVPEFGNFAVYTFSCSMDIVGNISIIQDPFSFNSPAYPVLQGISPGASLSSVTAARDLSTLTGNGSLTTNLNDAVFEWFGTASSPYWPTPNMPNPFDMIGRTMSCFLVSPGRYVVITS
jgi:hypothetical protein